MELASLVEVKTNPNVPQIRTGDTVRVSVKVVEGDRERTQNFQGLVIRMRRGGIASNITVRRVAYGVGVERTFFLTSPRLEKVEVLRHGKVRRANLYYLRDLSGKAAQLKERRGVVDLEVEGEAEIVEPEANAEASTEAAVAEPAASAEVAVAEKKAGTEAPVAEKKASAEAPVTETKASAEVTPAAKTEQPQAVKEVAAPEAEKSA